MGRAYRLRWQDCVQEPAKASLYTSAPSQYHQVLFYLKPFYLDKTQ
jgi:hypothetical protein